jgi:hypothetical protein
MTDLITSVTDLDDLDLDLESDGVNEITETAELDSGAPEINDEEELELDDLEDETTQPAAPNAQESDDLILDDEPSSIDDLKLDDEVVAPPVDTAKPELNKPVINLDDEIELDLDVNDGVKKTDVKPEEPAVVTTEATASENSTTPVVEAAKKTRKPRTPKAKEANVNPVVNVTSLTITEGNSRFECNPQKFLDREFPLDKLEIERYVTRTTVRSDEDITKLAEKIDMQGQAEPIHVYAAEDGKFYLMAGFGRYEAMTKKLKRTTAEAYVHKNLTEADVYKICTGTNDPRIQLTEWDKIVSVGKYADNNPTVSIDDINDTNSVVRVFGFSRSSAYLYLSAWKAFKNRPEFIEHFNKCGNNYSGYVYQVLPKAFVEYETSKLSNNDWIHILEIANSVSNRSTFASILVNATNEYILARKPATSLLNTLEEDVSNTDERVLKNTIKEEKETQTNADKITDDDISSLENEIVLEKDSKEVVDTGYQNVILTLTQTHSAMDCLLMVEKYQELKNPQHVKKIKEMICLIAEQAKKL